MEFIWHWHRYDIPSCFPTVQIRKLNYDMDFNRSDYWTFGVRQWKRRWIFIAVPGLYRYIDWDDVIDTYLNENPPACMVLHNTEMHEVARQAGVAL